VRTWCGKAESVKVAFDAELWLRGARRIQGWTFVSLPASQSEEIRDLAGPRQLVGRARRLAVAVVAAAVAAFL
jgi:hypothetical protein